MDEMRHDLCDECGQKEARYTVSILAGEKNMLRSLCPDCMARMNLKLSAGNVAAMLGAIMNAVSQTEGGGEASPAPAKAEKTSDGLPIPEAGMRNAKLGEKLKRTCPTCGASWLKVLKTVRAGCPDCYTAFRAELLPMLSKQHGVEEHIGRRPNQDEDSQQRRSEYERLSWHLQAAVQNEDYETAAVLRDQLRRLDQEGDGHEQ